MKPYILQYKPIYDFCISWVGLVAGKYDYLVVNKEITQVGTLAFSISHSDMAIKKKNTSTSVQWASLNAVCV